MPLHVCVIFTAFMLPFSIGTRNFINLVKIYASKNGDISEGSNSVPKSNSDDQIRTHGRSQRSRSDKFLSALSHVAGMVSVTYILQHHTLSHPFLVADNRYALARTLPHFWVRNSAFHVILFLTYFSLLAAACLSQLFCIFCCLHSDWTGNVFNNAFLFFNW